MKNPTWPFKDCETPAAFLAALRKDIPYRFKKWKYTCFIDNSLLRVHLEHGPGPTGGGFWISFTDIVEHDHGAYRRSTARSPGLRSFSGYHHIKCSSASEKSCAFQVALQHLPKIARLCELQRQLKQEEQNWTKDPEVRKMNNQLAELQQAIDRRRDALIAAFHEKRSADYDKIAAFILRQRAA